VWIHGHATALRQGVNSFDRRHVLDVLQVPTTKEDRLMMSDKTEILDTTAACSYLIHPLPVMWG
jgi:hypothetical protein